MFASWANTNDECSKPTPILVIRTFGLIDSSLFFQLIGKGFNSNCGLILTRKVIIELERVSLTGLVEVLVNDEMDFFRCNFKHCGYLMWILLSMG